MRCTAIIDHGASIIVEVGADLMQAGQGCQKTRWLIPKGYIQNDVHRTIDSVFVSWMILAFGIRSFSSVQTIECKGKKRERKGSAGCAGTSEFFFFDHSIRYVCTKYGRKRPFHSSFVGIARYKTVVSPFSVIFDNDGCVANG